MGITTAVIAVFNFLKQETVCGLATYLGNMDKNIS